jgi:hypothetical protein
VRGAGEHEWAARDADFLSLMVPKLIRISIKGAAPTGAATPPTALGDKKVVHLSPSLMLPPSCLRSALAISSHLRRTSSVWSFSSAWS